MARNMIACMIGIFAAFFTYMSIQSINYMLFPLPSSIDPNDQEAMINYATSLPSGAHIVVLVAHILGTLLASFVVAKIAQSNHRTLVIGVTAFLFAMGLVNVLRSPHPIWFQILDLLSYAPMAYLGYLLGRPKD